VNTSRHGSQVRSTIQKRDSKGVIRHGAEWLALWSDPESMKSSEEKRNEATASHARLELEKNLSAAARSLSGDPQLQMAFDPDIPPLRGNADSAALQHRFHDAALHQQLAPVNAAPRRLFNVCERVRCEALGAAIYPGVRENLVARQIDRLRRNDLLHAHLALLVPVAEALEMVVRDELLDSPKESIESSGFWMWDRWIRERFSPDLRSLKSAVNDQAEFARYAIPFVQALIEQIGSDESLTTKLAPSRTPADDGGEARLDDRLRENADGAILRPSAEAALERGDVVFIQSQSQPEAPPYKVFTTAHDRVAYASELLDSRHIRELRESLESRRADLRRDLARLSARFQRRLLARQTRDWSFDLDEGLLDASRLDRVIVNPGFASAYKQERESQFPDTIVTILIDNSGSMRGKPIEIACLAADLISAALDRCGIACEVLGFTTREWKGGQSAKEWVRAGRPADPGRLNDVLHIIYKAADEPARRSRASLAAMLDPGLLKENIDGEALLWASRRVLSRPQKRRILIVISDGSPVDQATLENNNDKQMLDRHLRQVIADIEESGAMELTAIGVKHDAGQYYPNSIQIEQPENLGASLIGMVDTLLVTSFSIRHG
jgi:cobaltochelatase CobT